MGPCGGHGGHRLEEGVTLLPRHGPDLLQAIGRREPVGAARLPAAYLEGRVRRYVDELPAGYRSVLLLSEDEGLTNRQIAEALGITVELAREPRAGGVSPGD